MAASPVVTLLEQLVQIPSVSGSPAEREGLKFVEQWFQGSDESTAEFVDASDGRDACVLVMPAHVSDCRLLLFSAHIDVVPVTNGNEWSEDPFGARVVAGRLHGRGSSDMKSGLAAAMIAIRQLHAQGVPVALAVSTGEELGCRGASGVASALESLTVGAVIIPESTGNRVVLGHRGALWLSVTTSGRAAHGSTPERGVNAILAMTEVLAGLPQIPLGAHEFLGAETANVGAISSGSVPNVVPDRCVIKVDHRLASTDPQEMVNWWRDRPGVSDVGVDLLLDPVWTNIRDEFVAMLPGEVSAEPASYFTDASVLVRTLPPRTPVVVWGPGDASTVHSADESVEITSVESAVHMFTEAGRRWQMSSGLESRADGGTDAVGL